MRMMITGVFLCSPLFADSGPKVAWQPWAPASFQKAKAMNKLVLVDAEATWCHWCHVMDEKTYGDVSVVQLLNTHAVAIKADIDIHPDAQERYSDIGWPGTTIYAPDGTTLYRRRGYIPAQEFKDVMNRLIADSKKGIYAPWKERAPEPAVVDKNEDATFLRAWAQRELDDRFDENQGGWGEQKYPISMNVEQAFAEAQRKKDIGYKLRALYTLKQQRNIVDPIWGGIFQYSVGPTWHGVHFEKLSALQAGYLENLAEAFQATGDTDFLDDSRSTLRYLRRFMRHPQGGFFASMDADVGGFDKSVAFVDGHDFYKLGDAERLKRGLPRIDARRYAKEQGLLIAALAKLHAVMEDPELLKDARGALEFAEAKLSDVDGLYFHGEDQRGDVYLADQAAMLKGLLALHESTAENVFLDRAQRLAASTLKRLQADKGPLRSRSASKDAVGVFAQLRFPFDENIAFARSLLKLYAFTGDPAVHSAARSIIQSFSTRDALENQGRWLGDALLAMDEGATEASHLTVVGARKDPRTQALHRAALGLWMPNRVVILHDPNDGGPRNPELGFPPLKEPAAFLCGKGTCSQPYKDPEKLNADIRNASK
jgi:uncharacterized protein